MPVGWVRAAHCELWTHIELVHSPLGDSESQAKGEEESEEEESEEEGKDVHAGIGCARNCGDQIDDDARGLENDVPCSSTGKRTPESSTARSSGSYPYVDKHQRRIRCRSRRCPTTIQLAGLRRHVEVAALRHTQHGVSEGLQENT